MGLYQQPNAWTCGPFALKHALVTLGQLANERDISRIANPHWATGTNEIKLARAARHFGFDLPNIRCTCPEQARKTLARYTSNATPVLLCVDQWGHWITVVSHHGNRFVILDSLTNPVVQVVPWPKLRKRWVYKDQVRTGDAAPVDVYDLMLVTPRATARSRQRSRTQVRAQFSIDRARFLRRPENAPLARHWDQYLEDLLQICRPRPARSANVLSMTEFLRRHQELLLTRVLYWHGNVQRNQVLRILRNFHFVAETYGLVIPIATMHHALIDLAILLAFWAVASRGVGMMYGGAGATPRPVRQPQQHSQGPAARTTAPRQTRPAGE